MLGAPKRTPLEAPSRDTQGRCSQCGWSGRTRGAAPGAGGGALDASEPLHFRSHQKLAAIFWSTSGLRHTWLSSRGHVCLGPGPRNGYSSRVFPVLPRPPAHPSRTTGACSAHRLVRPATRGGRDTPDHSGICIWKRFLVSCPSKGPSVILDTLALWGVTLNDVHLPQGRGLRARSEADVGLIPINYF